MVAEDMANIVKTDLQAGTFTRYTDSFPIYIVDEDKFQGGNVYIALRTPTRKNIYTATYSVAYRTKTVMLRIWCKNKTDRDKIYNDLQDILKDASNAYTITNIKDIPATTNLFGMEMKIDLIGSS